MKLKDKVEMYEKFLHKINMYCITGNNEGIAELVKNADRWSYAHRLGNGEKSDKDQQKLIDLACKALCDTPDSDSEVRKRQRAYDEALKNDIEE